MDEGRGSRERERGDALKVLCSAVMIVCVCSF